MPPRESRRAPSVPASTGHQEQRQAAGALGGARRGDRRADRQQGEGAQRRVPHALADVDPGHVLRRRGGQRRGRSGPKGRTRDQLYNEAKNLNIDGRSSMNKAQLQRAVDAKRG